MRQLSELDASFLYLETETAPMHIGGVYLFDARGSKPLPFSTFVAYLRSRLHVIPLFRQRLKEIPLRLGRPYWIDDANFSIERHLAYVNLGEHGKIDQLSRLASRILEEPSSGTGRCGTLPLWTAFTTMTTRTSRVLH